MFRLLHIAIFSSAFHRASDIIKNVTTIFKTLDTRLLDELCDVNTKEKIMSERNGSGERSPV